jgi:hypothetical protein
MVLELAPPPVGWAVAFVDESGMPEAGVCGDDWGEFAL